MIGVCYGRGGCVRDYARNFAIERFVDQGMRSVKTLVRNINRKVGKLLRRVTCETSTETIKQIFAPPKP